MTLPDGYTAQTHFPHTTNDEAPEWELIEDLCMHNDELYVERDGYQVGMLVNDINNELVGAMWFGINDSGDTPYYSFHAVVHPDHQGKGVGSALLDTAVSLYHEHKTSTPSLVADVYVVNEKVMQGLFNRGFSMSEDLRENPGDFVVAMSEAPGLPEFFKRALKASPAACNVAMSNVAEQRELAVADVFELCRRWCEKPDTLMSTEQQMLEQVVLALPLNEFDKKYMWSQVQKHAEQHALFPDPHLILSVPAPQTASVALHAPLQDAERPAMRR